MERWYPTIYIVIGLFVGLGCASVHYDPRAYGRIARDEAAPTTTFTTTRCTAHEAGVIHTSQGPKKATGSKADRIRELSAAHESARHNCEQTFKYLVGTRFWSEAQTIGSLAHWRRIWLEGLLQLGTEAEEDDDSLILPILIPIPGSDDPCP